MTTNTKGALQEREIIEYPSALYSTEYGQGYNQALDDVLTIIKNNV